MHLFHTLRGLLYLMSGVTLLGMVTLGGMAIHSVRDSAVQLDAVNSQAIAPLTLLQNVERRIKEVRFRIAGVALGQLPTVGSANHLKEVRTVLPGEWAKFYTLAGSQALPKEEKALLEKMDKGMSGLDALMVKLLTAYQGDDLGTVKSILEDEWPQVHSGFIKPLEQFMPFYQGAAHTQLQEVSRKAGRLAWVVGVVFVAAIGLVGMVTWIFQVRLSRQLTAAQIAVEAVSRFNLTQLIHANGKDEISLLLNGLGIMQNHLRDVVVQVRDGASALESMAGALAGASANVAGASNGQAESAAGMAASMEQLSVSIDQMREHASESNDLAIRSGEASREGRDVTRNAAQEMAAIAEGARQSASIVGELGELSSEISGIVNVIKEIADQTNLLALNAAIEAARAGEQGRGFAVVADEVRKLAERTSSSTQQISGMISRIQAGAQRAVDAMQADVNRANQGEELARKAGGAIDQIEQRASDVVRAVHEIQLALSEQSAAARDVAVRVEQIAQMTETNSSASQQTSHTASQVSSLAGQLNGLMARFQV
ncbi:MAG: methyl-accepting chemotaxis protein [Betaproteobacteria bacterium]|nr:methyl-accepting chemotaxis protein [Betaproteobacteria bacterium]